MPTDLASKLAEHGITGLLLAIALYVILKLYQANEKAHVDRITDAKAFREEQKLLAAAHLEEQQVLAATHLEKSTRMVEACTAAITAQVHVTDGYTKGLRELHETMEEYVDEARHRR